MHNRKKFMVRDITVIEPRYFFKMIATVKLLEFFCFFFTSNIVYAVLMYLLDQLVTFRWNMAGV